MVNSELELLPPHVNLCVTLWRAGYSTQHMRQLPSSIITERARNDIIKFKPSSIISTTPPMI